MKDWEAAYANNETPWDKAAAAPPLCEFLSRQPIIGSVLVPGCGAGHDVRLLATQGANVIGMDIAPSAIRKARSAPMVHHERYVVADFLNCGDEWCGRFDWVIEHTCLCALELEQRQAYVLSVANALKKGGHYLAIFYREVADYDSKGGPPHPISERQIEALFSNSFERIDSFVPTIHYPSRSCGSEEVVLFRK